MGLSLQQNPILCWHNSNFLVVGHFKSMRRQSSEEQAIPARESIGNFILLITCYLDLLGEAAALESDVASIKSCSCSAKSRRRAVVACFGVLSMHPAPTALDPGGGAH